MLELDESPGKIIKKNGKYFKSFRGMGSIGAMNKGSADRYFQKKQKDVSKYVPRRSRRISKIQRISRENSLSSLVGGLKSSMGYLGSKKIINLRNKPKFVKITKAGFYESMVHNIDEIKNNSHDLKYIKFILIFFLLIFNTSVYGKRKFFYDEAKIYLIIKNMKNQNFCFKEILFLTQKMPNLIYI